MTAKVRKPFQRRLFFSVVGVFLLLALLFSIYQYHREREYKTSTMGYRLQIYNYEVYTFVKENGWGDRSCFVDYVGGLSEDGLRVTLMDKDGNVLVDSRQENLDSVKNHKDRGEVASAIATGKGYEERRVSTFDGECSFYAATAFPDLVVRSSVPYGSELAKMLKTDNFYLFYVFAITLALIVVLYKSTVRVGKHIEYLRLFALKAEKGEQLDMGDANDELSDISQIITALYWKQRNSEEDKLRIKRQLTQNVAHELKTPAASIQGYLETIIQNPGMTEEKRSYFLERCFAQSERMSKLLLDMATLTKLDDMDVNLSGGEWVLVNVNEIVSAVLDDATLQLHNKGILAMLDMPAAIRINGSPTLVYSVFRNLVDNAVAYAVGATTINITCLEHRKSYEFVVSDNGCGVPSEHLPHIFERFYRVDKGRSRKLGGTGLGLAIVKNAVAAHGGTCSAYPTPGGGFSVKFQLFKDWGKAGKRKGGGNAVC